MDFRPKDCARTEKLSWTTLFVMVVLSLGMCEGCAQAPSAAASISKHNAATAVLDFTMNLMRTVADRLHQTDRWAPPLKREKWRTHGYFSLKSCLK